MMEAASSAMVPQPGLLLTDSCAGATHLPLVSRSALAQPYGSAGGVGLELAVRDG